METLEKILVIQTAFIGDAVLTLPMIQKLNEQKPNSFIYVLCIPSTKEVFSNSESVTDVVVYDKRGSQKSLLSFIKLMFYIRSLNFSSVISPHRSIRSTLISFFSGANNTVGFDNADLSSLYKEVVKYQKDKHEVERNISLINDQINEKSWRILPKIKIGSAVNTTVGNLLTNLKATKNIAVAPGSVWKTKVYPKEYFEEIIKLIISNGYGVVLIGGKEDSDLCNSIAKNFDKTVSFAGKLTIPESVEVLRNCTALVCNDSAPTHLAMIADIPTITIYCSTIPDFGFYPYNQKSKTVSFDELNCKPCGIHGHKICPIKTFECAYKLKPAVVFENLKKILPA
ncbi:MAG: ADP-heptose:LPS heptosyltransferase II [Ignavibacteria bacterium]|nr:MAG: ADP-heptose:LPS heptosyltransferase II [Ignavibacteria bacterium]KAF0161205.1 MAG: ADP-heptose:LPS heptosyltransferase II [Ignavibacteria bacterium]